MNPLLQLKVKKTFYKQFKSVPIMIFAPGRINLIGEHTDYNDGFVFPAAINKGIYLGLQKNTCEVSRVYAMDKNERYEFKLDSIDVIENGGWRNYVIGVIAELKKLQLSIGNFDMCFAGDIPDGAGMSSSAALENSVVYGLNELFELDIQLNEMVLISQAAEHNYAGVKCGIMDQYASIYGKDKSALLLDCRTVKSQAYEIDFKDYEIVLINTNVKHDLAETAYNDRRAVCEAVAGMLEVKALRDVTVEQLETIKNKIKEEDFKKALYVVEENRRAQRFAAAIEKGDIQSLGKLLYQSHDGLSNKFKVSCEELDFLVDLAKKSDDVLGARMMGGGFGGCTINLVHKKGVQDFKEHVAQSFLNKFNKTCTIYQVELSKGTRELSW